MLKRYSIAEARNRFAALIHRVEREAAIELTRRGKPVAVIMSVQQYRQLQAERGAFWDAFDSFRDKHDLQKLDIQPEIFPGSRDRSTGRQVVL